MRQMGGYTRHPFIAPVEHYKGWCSAGMNYFSLTNFVLSAHMQEILEKHLAQLQ